MAKKNFYAVAKGKTPGIYRTWEECKVQIEHVSGAVYKGFATLNEAEAFMGQTGVTCFENPLMEAPVSGAVKEAVSSDTHLIAYVDGSYEHSILRYAYGCAIILPEEVVSLNGSGDDPEYVGMRNVAGEILGSEKAVSWAVEHGYKKITIYYDYEGIEKWANGIWKANKPGTQRYQSFIKEQREKIEIQFCKVAAHTGVKYNELADRLAKEALGVST